MGCASSSLKDSAVAPSKEDEVYHTTTDSKRSSLETFPSVSTDPSSPSSSAVVHVGTSDDVNNEKEKEWGEELEVDGGSSEQQAASLGSASHSVHTSDVGMKPKVKALPASAPAMPFRIRKATSSVSGTGTGTGPSMDTDKGTATGVEVEEEAYLGPIRLIHLEDFANYGSVPRYPKCMQTKGTCETTKGQSMVFDIHDPDASQHFDRSKSFIVFISHCWLAGWDGCVAGKGVGSSYEDSLVPSDHTQRVLVSPEHADQWRGFPHPDNKNDDKYRLICEGVRNVWQTQAAGMKDCYLWMDYSCINQDGDPAGELLYLDQLVANADCLFTPIVDPEWTKWRSAGHQDLTTKERGKMGNSVSNINILISSSDDIGLLERSTVAPPSEVAAHDCFVQDWFQSYNAPAFRAPKFGYLERAWCRVEMLFASNLPISEVSPISHTSIVSKVKTENNTCKHAELKRRQTEVSQLEVASQGSGDYFEAEGGGVPGVMSASKTALVDAVNRAQMLELARRENFSSGLQRIAANGWRPQFLYGTMEQELGLPAKVMPPLSYTFVEKFNPVLGGLSVESDRDKIKVFLNELEPFIAKAKTVYKGERDTDTNLKSGSGQIVYEDGSTFEGTFNANQREGYGTFTWIQGSQYKGNYSNNLRNGYGELETASGRVYKGAWRDNLMEGQGHLVTQHEDFMGELKANCFVKGVLSFKTGDVYEGDFASITNPEGKHMLNAKHGTGTFKWRNGDCYEGSWVNDLQHGMGIMTYADGSHYEGSYLLGKMHGQGTYTNAAGDVYKGCFTQNKKNGSGVYTWKDGMDVYNGTYVDDMKQGEGTYVFTETEEKYVGEWFQDQRTGQGVFTFSDGGIYTGGFLKGRLHGFGVFRYPNGAVFEGAYVADCMCGEGTYTYVNGSIYSGSYDNDSRNGHGVLTRADGSSYSGDWSQNKMEGAGTYRWANGDVYTGQFKADCRHGRGTKTYDNGQSKHGLWNMDTFVEGSY